MTYGVRVERDQKVWFVEVGGVGATQARSLREVDEMARDLIAVTDSDQGADLAIEIHLPHEVQQHLVQSAQLRQSAAEAQSKAAEEVRAAARMLHDQGLTVRDIGEALGVSHQRAHQLISSLKLVRS